MSLEKAKHVLGKICYINFCNNKNVGRKDFNITSKERKKGLLVFK